MTAVVLALLKALYALIALLIVLLGYHVRQYTPYPSSCLPSQQGQWFAVTGNGEDEPPFLAVCITDGHRFFLNALS